MDEDETVNIILKVVRQGNKNQNDTFTKQDVPIFDGVKELREFLMKNFEDELAPATEENSFRLGYIGNKNRKFTISNDAHLAEAYSNVKMGWLTLWTDPHEATAKSKASNSNGSKRSFSQFMAFHANSTTSEGSEDSNPADAFDKCVRRLRDKHGKEIPEFKLKIWAKMVMNGTHESEDMPPNIPFFTGRKAGVASRTVSTASASASSSNSSDVTEGRAEIQNTEKLIQMRSTIIQQLKDLKQLQETEVLTTEEFEEQKAKLLRELSSL